MMVLTKNTSCCYYWLHVIAVLVPTVQTCILIAYYTKELALQTPTYVSDLLFSDPAYTASITACVVLQLLICLAYAYLHMGAGSYFEAVFIIAACVGWIMICTRYLDGDGKYLSAMHIAGVAVFVTGSALYFCTMLFRMMMITTAPRAKNTVYVCIVVVLLLASASCWVACVYYFADNYYSNDESPNPAWLFEHPAFATFAAAHAVFFTADWEQGGVNNNRQKKVVVKDPAAVAI